MHRVALALALALGTAAPTALAADDAASIVKYRNKVMDGLGAHMGATAMIIKGQIARPDDLPGHARSLAELSRHMKALFPEGTGPDDLETHSKKEIWTQRAKFDAACDTMVTEAEALAKIDPQADMDAFKAQFRKVGGACGDCHDVFRVEDDH